MRRVSVLLDSNPTDPVTVRSGLVGSQSQFNLSAYDTCTIRRSLQRKLLLSIFAGRSHSAVRIELNVQCLPMTVHPIEEQHFVWQLDRVRGSTGDLHLPDTTLEISFARVDSKRARRPTCTNGLRPSTAISGHLPEWSRLLRAAVNAVHAVDGMVDVSTSGVGFPTMMSEHLKIHPYATLALKILSWIPRVRTVSNRAHPNQSCQPIHVGG